MLNTSLNSSSDQSVSKQRKRKRTLDDYEFIADKSGKQNLGKGAFGSVRLAKDKRDQKIYAIKAISKSIIQENNTTEQLKREIKIQKRLEHNYIIKLYHEFEDEQNVYLVLEYAPVGNLFFYLRKKIRLKEGEAAAMFIQTCLGIDYLHKNNIIHRDLKPENLLLDDDGNIKICDFGWSAEENGNRKTFCGTMEYMSPEMIRNQPHDYRIDIWALGILLFEMLHGNAPFQMIKNNRNQITQAILACEVSGIPFSNGITTDAKDLIKGILRIEPANRFSMQQILDHPWIQRHATKMGLNLPEMIRLGNEPKGQEKKKEKEKPNFQELLNSQISSIGTQSAQSTGAQFRERSKSPVNMTEEMLKQKQLLLAPPQKIGTIEVKNTSKSIERQIFDNKPQSSTQSIDQSGYGYGGQSSALDRSKSREKIFDMSKLDKKSMTESVIQKYSNTPKASYNMQGSQNLQTSKPPSTSPQPTAEEISKQREREQIEMQKEIEKQRNIQRQRDQEAQQRQQEQERQKELAKKQQEKQIQEEIQRQKQIQEQLRIEAQRKQDELQKILEEQKLQTQREFEQRQKELLEQQQREIQKERQMKDQLLKEQQKREQELRDQIERERKIREDKERELREQQIREQQQREQLQKEQMLKDQQIRELQRREQELRDQQIKDQQQREQQMIEQKKREEQLREQAQQEILQRERMLKEQQLREQQLRDQQMRENQMREQQLREQQIREQQQRAYEEEQRRIEQMRQEQIRQQQLKQEMEQKRLRDEQEQYYRQRNQLQIPEDDRAQLSLNQSSISLGQGMKTGTNSLQKKEKEVKKIDYYKLEQKLDMILGQNFGLEPTPELPPMRADASFEASIQNKKMRKQSPDWEFSVVQNQGSLGNNQSIISDLANSKQKVQFQTIEEVPEASQNESQNRLRTQSPMSNNGRPTANRSTNNRPTRMEDRNTYIGDLLDGCIDDLDMGDNPQLQLFRQLDDPRQRRQDPQKRFQSMPPQQQERTNKFSFGEQKYRQMQQQHSPNIQEPDFGRQTKISPEPIGTSQYNNLRIRNNPQAPVKLNNPNQSQQSIKNYNYDENQDSYQRQSYRHKSLTKFDETPYDRQLKGFNKYDNYQPHHQMQQQHQSFDQMQGKNHNNQSFNSKQSQSMSSSQQNFNLHPKQYQSLQFPDPLGVSFNDKFQNDTNSRFDKEDEFYQKFGPRKSRISERNEVNRRKKEIQRNDNLQQLDFFDRVKFAFGCLARPQNPK